MHLASAKSIAMIMLILLFSSSPVASGDDDKIVGTWERLIGKDKDELEESWVVKKTKDKWTVSGTYYNLGRQVGNFKGKDVKFKNGELSFTQDFYKLPKGLASGSKIVALAEEDRLDVASSKGKVETKYNMKRAGDGSELVGAWKSKASSFKWTIEKNKKGEMAIRGATYDKTGKETGSWTGTNVRYFMRTLMFNQQYQKSPSKKIVNGRPVACTVRGEEIVYIIGNNTKLSKNTLTKETK